MRWDRVDEVGKQMLAVVGKGEAGNKMLERRVLRDWDYGWRLCARWNQDLLTRVMKAAADIDMSGDHSRNKKKRGATFRIFEYLFHFLFFNKKNKLHVDTCACTYWRFTECNQAFLPAIVCAVCSSFFLPLACMQNSPLYISVPVHIIILSPTHIE